MTRQKRTGAVALCVFPPPSVAHQRLWLSQPGLQGLHSLLKDRN